MADLRQGVCPKCDHHRTLHVTQIADALGDIGGSTMNVPLTPIDAGQFLPWRLARVPNQGTGIFSSSVAAAGIVEAYVCAACGFTELYTRQPERIPVDGTLVREIRGPKSGGPFR